MTKLTTNEKKSFWVIKNDEAILLEGFVKTVEGNWTDFEDYFFSLDEKEVYHRWFNTKEEAIQNEIDMAQFQIEFETEMWEVTLGDLKTKKEFWIEMLNKTGGKNE